MILNVITPKVLGKFQSPLLMLIPILCNIFRTWNYCQKKLHSAHSDTLEQVK